MKVRVTNRNGLLHRSVFLDPGTEFTMNKEQAAGLIRLGWVEPVDPVGFDDDIDVDDDGGDPPVGRLPDEAADEPEEGEADHDHGEDPT